MRSHLLRQEEDDDGLYAVPVRTGCVSRIHLGYRSDACRGTGIPERADVKGEITPKQALEQRIRGFF